MTREYVFNLIARNRDNLIKIGKAVRVDFDGLLGSYIIFDKIPTQVALMKVSDEIVKEYEDKMDIWISIQEDLRF